MSGATYLSWQVESCKQPSKGSVTQQCCVCCFSCGTLDYRMMSERFDLMLRRNFLGLNCGEKKSEKLHQFEEEISDN